MRSEQIWTPSLETAPRDGWGLGAFVEVALPPSLLSVIAEGLVVQRGARLTVESGGRPGEAEVESDYLVFPILLKVRYFLDPMGLYAVGGPAVEYLLRTRSDPALDQVYGFEKPTVGGVILGAGAEGLISGRVAIMVEARLNEGFTPAYEGGVADVRHRSVELLFRLGFRPPTESPAR